MRKFSALVAAFALCANTAFGTGTALIGAGTAGTLAISADF